MTRKDNGQEPFVGLNVGDRIRGEHIWIQAYEVICHKKPRSYSRDKRQTGEAKRFAEAWIVKKLRFSSGRQ